jgi:hypothetical protein
VVKIQVTILKIGEVMKKQLMVFLLLAPFISSSEVAVAPAKSESAQIDVAVKRQSAMQKILLKSFGGIDHEVMEKCVQKWSDDAKCADLRSFLIQYLVIEDICRQTIEESINQAKDQILVVRTEGQA